MSTTRSLRGRAVLAVAGVLLLPVLVAAQDTERVIVRAAKPYTSISALVASLGGRVDYKYENVDAIAVTIPRGRLAELGAAVGQEAITKDNVTAPPRPLDRVDVASEDGEAPSALAADAVALSAAPQDYSFNNDLIGATALHASGQLGAGVTVAVIDSGTANAPVVPALAGTVIGGENFVPPPASPPGATEPSATSRLNDPHGTWVGTVIAGHASFVFAATSTLVRSLQVNAPGSVIAPNPITCPVLATQRCIPMVGMAPAAKIYALKVFPPPAAARPSRASSRPWTAPSPCAAISTTAASTATGLGTRHREQPVRVRRAEDRGRQHEPRRSDAVRRPRPRGSVHPQDARRRHHHGRRPPATTASRP